jgi:glycosyltransferase involved in cell wall biosynthesis
VAVRSVGTFRDVAQVVLPVLDEVRALPGVLAGLPSHIAPIVVDNGSTDGSAELASSLGAEVVRAEPRGFGAACWAGLVVATHDTVCFMDCDGSLAGRDLSRVLDPLDRGDADLVLGARRPVDGAWSRRNRLANRALASLVRRRTGLVLSDIGPMRAARRTALLELGLNDRRYGWPLEMVLRAAAAGWRVAELPVTYHPRVGRSKVTGTVLGTARAVSDMARVAATVPPVPAGDRPSFATERVE